MKMKIAIADDHQLFLKSVQLLINDFDACEVIAEAVNGEELLQKFSILNELPDIVLLDVDMPRKNGIDTALEITKLYPSVKIVALSMKDDDATIINMLKAGACAYLLKDMHPVELEKALHQIYEKGYYNADAANVNYRRLITKANEVPVKISDKEQQFLQLAGSDLTYKEIADRMCMSVKTIDGYRESLFVKFNVKSRVGMVLEGMRLKLILL
jgi:DNA-binding NarL/FixJ family response regulator